MKETVRLTLLTGPHKGHRYCLRGKLPCVLGRTVDCAVQLTGESLDQLTSRHHCQLLLDPPCVWLQDLGSTNGTYLNGQRIEADRGRRVSPQVELNDGDVVMVGASSIRVEVITCPNEVAASDQAAPLWANGRCVKKDCPIGCRGRQDETRKCAATGEGS